MAEATFTRNSIAYRQDGTQVAANVPRFEPGVFGQAVMVEEGTTNYCTYSDLSDHVDVVNGSSSIVKAVHNINGVNRNGLTWIQGPTTEIVNFSISVGTLPTTSGQVVTISAWVYCTKTNNIVKSQIRCTVDGATYWLSADGLSWVTSTVETYVLFNKYTAVGTWQKISFTLPAFPAGSLQALYLGGFYRGTNDFTFKIAGVQVEIKQYATSLMATSGAIATRSPETLTIPTAGVLNPQEGTVECWVYVNDIIKRQLGGSSNGMVIFIPRLGGSISIYLTHRGDSPVWEFRTHADDSTYTTKTVSNSYTPNGWHFFTLRWSLDRADLFIDGVLRGTISNPKLPSGFYDIAYVGCRGSGYHINTLIDDLRISNRARTDEEILTTYNSGQPIVVDEYTTLRYTFNNQINVGRREITSTMKPVISVTDRKGTGFRSVTSVVKPSIIEANRKGTGKREITASVKPITTAVNRKGAGKREIISIVKPITMSVSKKLPPIYVKVTAKERTPTTKIKERTPKLEVD